MNDKEIRNILIEYLKSVHQEVRIYQEKSIGSSICDVMAVTDKLIGFEIKSDADNYERLQSQTAAYTRFFDENYIVVSRKHIKSAYDKVPDDWGIVYITEGGIELEKKARLNKNVSRRRQLSILWKLELKNLLIKNNLPSFAQKEKGYIADKIAAQVDGETLGKQIAQELMTRDYSVYNATDYTVYNKSELQNLPAADIVDALSESDFSQITLDEWIKLYNHARTIQEKKNEVYQAKPIVRAPHDITYQDIEAVPGVPWISADIINDFILFLSYGENLPKRKYNHVSYEPVTGAWHVRKSLYRYVEQLDGFAECHPPVKYGTERYSALHIMDAILNLREIKIFDNKKYNEKETIAALEKKQIILDTFKEWLWQDEDRRWQVEEAYNNMFGKFVKTQYDGSALRFPKMSKAFELFDYQKDAVQKILSTRNTLLAFDVGAGKTFIMIAAAMNMRQEGMSRKNMFVVPNNIVGQWEKIFTDLYPHAKVLAIEPKTFKPKMRDKVLTQIRDGDYDGIIIAYSCFEMIPLSLEYITNDMQSKLNNINAAIQSLRQSHHYIWGKVPLNRQIEYVKKLAAELMESADARPDAITFDKLEVDTIFLDEAHNYKNIRIKTNLKNLRGINTTGSSKCLNMLQKVRCVQQNGGGAVFATGTPLCNSISDVYTMQMYLQYDELHERKLDIFDNWVKTFAQPEQLCEVDVDTSKFRIVRRFAKFYNLPELSKMFAQTAIFHAMDNTDGLPEVSDRQNVIIPKNKNLSDYMKTLCERTEEIRSGKIDRGYDNMLKVCTDGRKAALDLTLVGREQVYGKTSKIYQCVNNVWDTYQKYEGCSQLVFCDYSTPKKEKYSVYQELKRRLIDRGIPEKEIAFIHTCRTESTRLKLYENVNKGIVRVLIGSTFKLGIGANVQTRLKAIHHLDVPWRPADMVQREGRILRRGNENKEIMILRYIAEGSFDSYAWQVLETKQRFISQFLTGSSYERSATDLENNVLSYGEVKALALAEPLMKKLAEKENELRNLNILCAKEKETQEMLYQKKTDLEKKIPQTKERLQNALQNEAFLAGFTGKEILEKAKQYRKVITNDVLFSDAPKVLFEYLEFSVSLPKYQTKDNPYIILERNEVSHIVEMGDKPGGNMQRIINFMKTYAKTVQKIEDSISAMEQQLIQLSAEITSENKYAKPLKACREECEQLRKMIEVRE